MVTTRLDLQENFALWGCNSFVLCLKREGDTEVISAKEKGIGTWLDAHIWTWIRSLTSCFRNTSTISYKFEEILPALQRANVTTTVLQDIFKGFNVKKYNTKHPQVREEFFRLFSNLPFFPATFEAYENAIQPGTLETPLTQFQQEIEKLGQEFDRTWPERSWAHGSSSAVTITDFDLLRGSVSNLQHNNRACGGNTNLLDRLPGRVAGLIQERGRLLFQEKETIIDMACLEVSRCNTSLIEQLPTIEAEFGKEKIEILRKWVSDVDQCCRKAQQAIRLSQAVHNNSF